MEYRIDIWRHTTLRGEYNSSLIGELETCTGIQDQALTLINLIIIYVVFTADKINEINQQDTAFSCAILFILYDRSTI